VIRAAFKIIRFNPNAGIRKLIPVYSGYHSFSAKHLRRDIAEFPFRLNEGNCAVHTLDWVDSFLDKIVGARVTYRALIT